MTQGRVWIPPLSPRAPKVILCFLKKSGHCRGSVQRKISGNTVQNNEVVTRPEWRTQTTSQKRHMQKDPFNSLPAVTEDMILHPCHIPGHIFPAWWELPAQLWVFPSPWWLCPSSQSSHLEVANCKDKQASNHTSILSENSESILCVFSRPLQNTAAHFPCHGKGKGLRHVSISALHKYK